MITEKVGLLTWIITCGRVTTAMKTKLHPRSTIVVNNVVIRLQSSDGTSTIADGDFLLPQPQEGISRVAERYNDHPARQHQEDKTSAVAVHIDDDDDDLHDRHFRPSRQSGSDVTGRQRLWIRVLARAVPAREQSTADQGEQRRQRLGKCRQSSADVDDAGDDRRELGGEGEAAEEEGQRKTDVEEDATGRGRKRKERVGEQLLL